MADLEGINGMREKFNVVGRSNVPGRLSPQLATGMAKFGLDYTMPNMLFAKFLRSPYGRATVKSVDTTRARKLPGVVDIVTWEDEDVKQLIDGGGMFGGVPRPYLDNLAEREGEEVAIIVIAESDDICDEALSLLDIDWEVLPHYVDIMDAKADDAATIRPQIRTNPAFGPPNPTVPPKKGNVGYANLVSGDIDEGFKQADHIVEYELNTPTFASHLPNPPGSIAWWSHGPYSDGLELHMEGAVRERHQISALYDVPQDKIIQKGLYMGGKYCDWGLRKSQIITPLLAKRTGRPVRCVNTREETFDFMTNQRFMSLKVGFKEDGLITAIDDYSIADGGTWGNSVFSNVGDFAYGPYLTFKCQNVRQQMEVIDSNRGKMYLSGQHCPYNWDAGTMAIYLIAEKLGKDPLDIARLNLHGPDSQEDMNPVPSFDACIETGRNSQGWEFHPAGAKTLPDGRLHGSAFRYQMSPRHANAMYQCKLELRDGVVHLPTQGPLFGVFAVECNAMVVAEELGIEYDDIAIDFDYTERFTPVGGGADGTTASSWAMKECANILKEKILKAVVEESEEPYPFGIKFFNHKPAPPFAGYKPEDLDIADRKIFVKSNPEINAPLSCITRDLHATFIGRPPISAWTEGMGRKLDCMNTAYVEVAVDTETGEVEVLRFSVVADTGLVMRRTSLESQIDQVMYFSHGCQLLEDYYYDKRTGVRLNNNMLDYKKPGMLDIPPVDREFLETRLSNAAYGATGISHALANTHLVTIAIHNAIGKWVDPPATPDVVLRALGKV